MHVDVCGLLCGGVHVDVIVVSVCGSQSFLRPTIQKHLERYGALLGEPDFVRDD